MKKYERLIFVDQDDSARAPMVAAIMSRKSFLDELKIESRGMVVLFPGPINQKAEAILVSHGLTMADHVTQQIAAEDITEKTLVLTMEEEMRDRIRSEITEAGTVMTVAEYLGLEGEILTLHGEPLSEYGRFFEAADLLLDHVAEKINEEELMN